MELELELVPQPAATLATLPQESPVAGNKVLHSEIGLDINVKFQL